MRLDAIDPELGSRCCVSVIFLLANEACRAHHGLSEVGSLHTLSQSLSSLPQLFKRSSILEKLQQLFREF